MTALFKKLNYKEGQAIYAFNVPDGVRPAVDEMKRFADVLENVRNVDTVDFAIVFATKQSEVNHYADLLAPRLKGDAVLWFCYPKGSSKRYKCEFNRDTGWTALGTYGLEGVRQVAVDEDWSALRFRKEAFVKNMTRRESMALSEKGKARTAGR